MMQIDITKGLLAAAHYAPTDWHDERPIGTRINLLVIHNISLPAGEFGQPYIKQLFCGRLSGEKCQELGIPSDFKASTHLFIDRQGDVTQFVPFHRRAWHAGRSSFQGVDECNDYSIGIELEGTDTVPYTDAQYEALATITRQLIQTYPGITRDRITSHSTIAPDRKTDPGPSFDWKRYFELF